MDDIFHRAEKISGKIFKNDVYMMD